MTRWIEIAVAVGALLVSGVGAARNLAVPADKGWQHAETGLILPAHVGGLSRTALTDATEDEHDIAAQFGSADGSVLATLYLFHPAVMSVPMWFDRSRNALESRDLFRDVAPATADPIAFAPPGSTTTSALRQGYASAGGTFRSTELAVVPVGDWIVAIRMSGKTLTAAQLDQRLQQVIAAIRWPAVKVAAPAAVPVKTCATPLAFGKAKVIKTSGADALIGLMMSGALTQQAAKDEPKAPPPVWCRDGKGQTEYGVYRSDDDAGYTLALYDAGRTVNVFPSLMGQVDKTGTYTVSMTDVDGSTSAFPSFTALPTPKQVWDLVAAGKRSGTMKGTTLTLDPKALR